LDFKKDLEKPRKPRRNRAERRKNSVNKEKKLETYLLDRARDSWSFGGQRKDRIEWARETSRKRRDHYSEGGRRHGEYNDWDERNGDPTYRWLVEENKRNILKEIKKEVNTVGLEKEDDE
jgi:hypothetical protein